MRKILWEEKYSVGNDELDEHHKIIFELLRNCYETSDQSEIKYLLMFRKLYECCLDHFKVEEEIMAEIGFPFLVEHAAEHREMTSAVESVIVKFYNGENVDIIALNDFISSWVEKHIMEKDLEMKKYFLNSQVEPKGN